MRKDLLGSAGFAKAAAMSTVVTAIALLAGCSTTGQIAGETMEQATAPLTCTNKAECDAWWARAQVWVSNHSEYKLQTVTDSIIQTDGPSGGKRALAYQITKTPSNEGTATIGFAAHCDNMLGCEPNPWKAGADFKQFVRGGPSQMGTPGGATASGNALPPVSPAPPSQPDAAKPARAANAADAAESTGTIRPEPDAAVDFMEGRVLDESRGLRACGLMRSG